MAMTARGGKLYDLFTLQRASLRHRELPGEG
jgi:hypothetical protein